MTEINIPDTDGKTVIIFSKDLLHLCNFFSFLVTLFRVGFFIP